AAEPAPGRTGSSVGLGVTTAAPATVTVADGSGHSATNREEIGPTRQDGPIVADPALIATPAPGGGFDGEDRRRPEDLARAGQGKGLPDLWPGQRLSAR